MLAGIFFVLLVVQAPVQADPDAVTLIVRGVEALQQENLAAAEAALAEARELEPDNPLVYFHLGEVYVEGGEYAWAIRQFRKAIDLAPEAPEPYLHLAVLQARLERFADARKTLEQLLAVDSSHPDAHLLYGRIASDQKDYAAAEKALRRYTELQPEDLRGWGQLGVALLAQEKFDEAETYLSRALEKAPRSGRAHYNLGLLYSRRGEHQKARRHLEEATRLLPEDAGAYYRLGTVLQRQGELEQARAVLEQALALEPKNLDALYALGTVLQRLGRADEAAKLFARHERLSRAALQERQRERRISAYHLNVRTLLEENRLLEAHAKLQEVLALDPQDALAHYRLGQIYYLQHDYRRALAAARTAIELRSYEPAFHMLEGMCRERLGEPTAARVAYERVLEFTQYAEAYEALGRLELEGGNAERAVARLRRAVELEPQNAELRLALAEALRRAGREAEAREELSAAERLRNGAAPR